MRLSDHQQNSTGCPTTARCKVVEGICRGERVREEVPQLIKGIEGRGSVARSGKEVNRVWLI